MQNKEDQGKPYFQAKAYEHNILFTFTVDRNYLQKLGVDILYLKRNANIWDIPTNGDKGKDCEQVVCGVINEISSIRNPLNHMDIIPATCVLSSALGGMVAIGRRTEAVALFEEYSNKLNQDVKQNLFKKVNDLLGRHVPEMNLIKIAMTNGGITRQQLMEMDDKWPIILQITSEEGERSHWICICDGWIYDANSNYLLHKTINNLNSCARLHDKSDKDEFLSTGMAYYYVPRILNFNSKQNRLYPNSTLPLREGFEYFETRQCHICSMKKVRTQYSIKQWWSFKHVTVLKGKCKDCSM